MRKNNKFYLRKAHRWLGVLIGIQFLFWTISGLYFSWTDIDEIHGDHFLNEVEHPSVQLSRLSKVKMDMEVERISLRFIGDKAYFWLNNKVLVDAESGEEKAGVTKEEALIIAQKYVKPDFKVAQIQLVEEVDVHHEYRERPLPAWRIDYEGDNALSAYISQRDGSFQRVRHRDWRWFDFLWMTHTMDYESRDNINNWLLRIFSVFGLLTVFSGFALFFFTTKRGAKLIN